MQLEPSAKCESYVGEGQESLQKLHAWLALQGTLFLAFETITTTKHTRNTKILCP